MGPKTLSADSLHAMKYRGEGEDFREAMNRVAFALKDSDSHYHELREILLHQRFVPAGRIQASMGSTKQVTPYNCFVSGTISDSFTDGPGNIMQRATEAAATMRQGGGIGYDFSTLRPRGSLITKLQSHSSGPISFMQIFNAICLATSSSGHRRGAQMGVLRVDHPDIEEFIRAKQNSDRLNGFNLSVAITDEFMEAVEANKDFELRWNGLAARSVDAGALWEALMRSTWDWAEPGVIFIDRMNAWNNLYYCEEIAATNPCSEQPLGPFSACLLGSFNLVKYLADGTFDFDLLKRDIPIAVRGMDNIVDRARYPLAEQRAEAHTKRRMGLGVMGLANAIEALGAPYATQEFISLEEKILNIINIASYEASIDLAIEKGPFPLFDSDRYCRGKFISTLPEETRHRIAKHGIRNSHLTSIAPTGTISQTCDNVSSGIEPTWAYEISRTINTPGGQQQVTISDYGSEFLKVRGRLAHELTPTEHIDVLCAAQKYVDSAISKTINVASSLPWDKFKNIYKYAYENGAKSCATYTEGGARQGLLSATSSPEAYCRIDPITGERSCE